MCTHNSPNITQLPKTREFRELLTVPDDKVLIDVDAGALELVTLGHYLGKFDNYEFAKIVDSGDKSNGTDIHTINQKRVGLATRDLAKTLNVSVLVLETILIKPIEFRETPIRTTLSQV